MSTNEECRCGENDTTGSHHWTGCPLWSDKEARPAEYADCSCNPAEGHTHPCLLAPLTFTLTITLGNDAMQTGEDVAEALNRAADNLWGVTEGLTREDSGTVWDANGNTVGEWSVQ